MHFQTIEAWDFPKVCMNRVRGCDFSAKKTEFGNHEDRCELRLVLCPDIGCLNEIQFNLMLTHLKTSRGQDPRFSVVEELKMNSG